MHRAIVLKRQGSLVEAEREAARACEELSAQPARRQRGGLDGGRRHLPSPRSFDRAEEAFARAHEISGSPCAALALLRLAQGRTTAARSIIGGCMEGTTNRLARTSLLPSFVQVAVAAGDLDGAGAGIDELEQP